MLKVAKFGGSSVASPEQFKKVKHIVSADEDRKIIVVSAAGKKDSSDQWLRDSTACPQQQDDDSVGL